MKKIVLFLIFAFFLSVPALAVDTSELEDALPDSAREILGDVTVSGITGERGIFQKIWQRAKDSISAQISAAARSACIALTVTLLCSVAASMSPDGKMPGYVLLGGALAVMGACAGDINSFLDQARDALADLSDFSKAFLPCVAASAAAAGSGAAGAARYAASALFFDVLMTLGTNIILPLIYAYGAVSTANAALPDGALGGLVKLMSWICTTLLTALTTIFTLCLSLTGIIAGNADKLAGSVAKTTISAALPVVGKILADAADTYLAGAQILRSAVGVFGLAAVLCVCLGPLVGLGLHYLLFKAAASISEPFSDGRLSALVGNIATAYGMALGLLGSAAAMLFVSAILGTEALTG